MPILSLGASAALFSTQAWSTIFLSLGATVSILLHETGHLWGLRRWEDPTPGKNGWTSLNPLRAISPVGTLLLPAISLLLSTTILGHPILIGGAKLLPVDFNRLADPKRDSAKVAAMGPAVNLALAALAGAAYLAFPASILAALFKMNLAITAFNLLPLPWHDGFKMLVGVFPNSLYRWWIRHPNLAGGYQALYQKIFEGPARALTYTHAHDVRRFNLAIRGLMFATLILCYAALFPISSLPLIFLFLPCGFDYRCIAEKARSDEAVQSMHDILGSWAGALHQIAEGMETKSLPSKESMELTLVGAIDQLLENLMKEEAFLKLSEEEKAAEFTRRLPAFLAPILRERDFSEDDEATVLRMLADPRNQPFLQRLEAWLRNPMGSEKPESIFQRMADPHLRQKVEEALEEARRRLSAGGSAMSALVPLLFFPHASSWLHSLFSSAQGHGSLAIGTMVFLVGALISQSPEDPASSRDSSSKIIYSEDVAEKDIWIDYPLETSEEDVRQSMRQAELIPQTDKRMASPIGAVAYQRFKVITDNPEKAAHIAQQLARQSAVARVHLHAQDTEPRLMPRKAAPKPAPALNPAQDPQAAWQAFLESHKKSKGGQLEDADVQFLSAWLKPMDLRKSAPIVGMGEYIADILKTLFGPRGGRTCVYLMGLQGVGKTAAAEGAAQFLYAVQRAFAEPGNQELSHFRLERYRNRWLARLDADKLLSENSLRPGTGITTLAELERVLSKLSDPDPRQGNQVAVFIDEYHRMIPFADQLKEPMAKGQVSILGATNERKKLEADPGWERRGKVILVKEPDEKGTLRILRGIKAWLEYLHQIRISDSVLAAVAKLTHRFDWEHQNPAKAVDLLKETAEEARPDNLRAALTMEIETAWEDLAGLAREGAEFLRGKGLESTIALKTDLYKNIARLCSHIASKYEKLAAVRDQDPAVTRDRVESRLAKNTGIPLIRMADMDSEEITRYLGMEKELGKTVLHQEEAIAAIARALRRDRAGLADSKKPKGKFLFVGPTGVGKTHLARQLAKFVFGDEDAMIRIDMSEYQASHSEAKISGAPPGYIGYDEAATLIEKVRRNPYCVILLDEIEKAAPQVRQTLLQALDSGHMTDSAGRVVDFSNTIIVMTSNAGMETVPWQEIARSWREAKDDREREEIRRRMDAAVAQAAKDGVYATFSPEFRNRLDRHPDSQEPFFVFHSLTEDDMPGIAQLQIKAYEKRLAERHDSLLELTQAAWDLLARRGFDPLNGARPMEAAITNLIIDPLAGLILQEMQDKGNNLRGSLIRVDPQEDTMNFTVSPKSAETFERAPLEGPAQQILDGVLHMIETAATSKPGRGPEMSGQHLNSIFHRQLAPKPAPPASDPAPAEPSVLESNVSLSLPPGAKIERAQNNRPNGRDKPIQDASQTIVASARAAGWPAEVLALLKPEPGSPETGWIERFIGLAKEAQKDAAEPVELVSSVDEESIRILIHGSRELDGGQRSRLENHFGKMSPADTSQEAWARARRLNQSESDTYSQELFDLHRRIANIPGARLGFASGPAARGGGGSDYWLEIRRPRPQAATRTPLRPLTAEQEANRAKTIAVLTNIIEQPEDAPVLKSIAARAYGLAAGPEEVAAGRLWLKEKGWDADETTHHSARSHRWPRIMAIAAAIARHGGTEDIPALEAVAEQFDQETDHKFKPVQATLTNALAALYARAGLERTREAFAANFSDSITRRAAQDALASLGDRTDLDKLRDNPKAYVELLERTAPKELEALIPFYWPPQVAYNDVGVPTSAWSVHPRGKRIAVLHHLGRRNAGTDVNFKSLASLLHGKLAGASDPVEVLYAAAEAFSDVTIREGRVQGLAEAFKTYFKDKDITHWRHLDSWPQLLALIYTAARAADPTTLPELERLLEADVHRSVQPVHEQAFYEAPVAWAQTVVFSGRFDYYARPQHGEAGVVKPSKLDKMLTSQRPMVAAAAAYAMALRSSVDQIGIDAARTLYGIRDPALPTRDMPDILSEPPLPRDMLELSPKRPAPSQQTFLPEED